jgi:hypothetical protein
MKTASLKCVGWIPGRGKYSGLIGALALTGIVKQKDIQICVGEGMTEDDRRRRVSSYIGKIIEVVYDNMVEDPETHEYILENPKYLKTNEES